MKTHRLIAVILIMIIGMQNVNAQEPSRLKSDFNCWVYNHSDSTYPTLRGVLHSVTDSAIIFAASASGNTFREDDRQLRYLPVTDIDKIKIRKKGNVGKGMLIGAGTGFLIGGILGLSGATDYGIFDELDPGENALIGGTLFSIPGIIIGGIIGSLRLKIPINRNQDEYIRQKEKIRSYAIVK